MSYRHIVFTVLGLLGADIALMIAWETGHADFLLFAFPELKQAPETSAILDLIADTVIVGIPILVMTLLIVWTLTRQARITKDLAASQQRLSDFTQAAYEWLWEMDADLRFRYFSDHFEKVTGMSPQSILGRRRDEIAFDKTDTELWQRHIDDLAHRRPFRNFEYRIVGPSGRVNYFSINGIPIFDAYGTFAGYRGTGSIITERKLTEERTRENQKLLRAIIDAVPAIVNLKDRHGRFLLVNRYQAQAFGMEPEEMIGRTPEEVLGTPQGHLFTASDLGVLASGQPLLNYELEWTDRFGLTHLMLVSKIPLKDSSGASTQLVSVALDITDRRRMEESAQQLMAAIEAAPDLFVIYDAEDRIAVTNQKFRDLNRASLNSATKGITFEEHIRRIVKAGLVPDAIGREEEWISWRLERHRNPTGPFELRRQQGQILRITEHRVRDGSTVTMSVDVTELKRIETELRAAKEEADFANRTKSEFLANMSHELRTPLNAIIGFTDILVNRRFGRDDPRYDSYLKDVNDAGRDLLRLINDIIDISRIERGQLVLSERNLDVPRMMSACYRLVLGRAHEARVHIAVDLPSDFPALHADELRVKQALLNILANAVKFTPEGGRISFGVKVEPDGGVAFTVMDSGIGIRAEDITKVMTVFGQADGSLARNYDGAGLGLPMTRSLMELHGGEMTIDSTPGVGTTVQLRFPKTRTIKI